MYTTPQNVRDLLGLTIEQAPDDILEEFIEKAQNVILHHIQIKVQDEVASLDTSGTTFSLDHQFIADTNFDKVINASDVKVYGWVDSDHIETRVELSISTLWPEHGIIKLSEDASSYDQVTVDYSYYTCAIDWNLVEMATAYYAGMLWVAREEYLVPEQLAIGSVRVRQRQPWQQIRNEFLRIVFHLTELPMDIVAYRKIMVSPRSSYRYKGPGATLEVEESGTSKYVRPEEAK